MYRLDQPTAVSSQVYKNTVKTIRDRTRRNALLDVSNAVQQKCSEFDDIAGQLKFESARSVQFRIKGIDPLELKNLYDLQFSKRKGVQKFRDDIRNAAPNAVCPYCGEGKVAQIDHYLPKESFAGLAVHPSNLVPACGECNQLKRAYKPGSSRPAVLNPYFDEKAFDTPWLSAKLNVSTLGLPAIEFEVSLTPPFKKLKERLQAHMDIFQLGRRFGTWAGQTLDDFDGLVRSDLGRDMGIEDARIYLSRAAVQHSGGRVNSWEGSALRAMGGSDWYLGEHLGLK